MRATLCACLCCLGAGLPLAACGDEGPTDEEQVRETLAAFGRATASKDYDVLCDRILAPDLVEQVTSIGLPCEVALQRGLGAVEEPRLTVGRVRVEADAREASAEVRTSARGQDPSQDVVELVKVRDRWRIASLAGAAPPSPGS